MKLTVTLSLLTSLFITATTQAQIKKGEVMLGTSLSFNQKSQDLFYFERSVKTQSSTIQVMPALGFGLGNNWIIGPQIGFTNTTQESPYISNNSDIYVNKTSINVYALGVWARKFKPFTSQFGIYGEIQAAAGFGKSDSKERPNYTVIDSKITTIAAGVQPGLYFLPGKKIIIEGTFGIIGYNSTKYKLEEGDVPPNKESDFNISFTEGLSLGIKFIL